MKRTTWKLQDEHDRLFKSGAYLKHFQPESKNNPFANLYAQKRQFVLGLLECRGLWVLDVGGGMGRISLPLSVHNNVILGDLSLDMLKIAKEQKKTSTSLLCVDCHAEDLPFGSRQFDVVIGLDLLCHLKKPAKFLSEVRRVMKEQGIFITDSSNKNPMWIFSYPDYIDIRRYPLKFLKTLYYGGVTPEWKDRVTHIFKRQFYRFLESCGFQIITKMDFGPSYCSKWNLAVCKMSGK